MQRVRIAACLLSLFFIVASSSLAQAQSATLEGTVHSLDGEGIGSVRVVLKSPDRIVFTDDLGAYSFGAVAPGSYLISFHYGGLSTRAEVVQIRDGITLTVDKVVETDFRLFMSVSVTAVSRRPEPVIDAPAAVTTVGSERIELEGGGLQIPALLQFTPGVEYAQSGLYDINLNSNWRIVNVGRAMPSCLLFRLNRRRL